MGKRGEGAAESDTGRWEGFDWQNLEAFAQARVLLALGNPVVVFLDPGLPPGRRPGDAALAYVVIVLLIGYAGWAWRQVRTRQSPRFLPYLTTWLDVLLSAALIAVTGAHKSPFYMWNVFTIIGSALKGGRRTVVGVCLASISLYLSICLPHLGQPDFLLGVFLVRTTYLSVIALVLAYMGQGLLEQGRKLVGLHTAATYICAGGSVQDILDRTADCLMDLLEAQSVAVAVASRGSECSHATFANFDPVHGGDLVRSALSWMEEAPCSDVPCTRIWKRCAGDAPFPGVPEALDGVRELLVTRLPGSGRCPGVLIAINCLRDQGFRRIDREMSELLAVQAAPLLESARVQEERRYNAGVDERRRIAAELHDRLIQTLASLDLRLLSCCESWRGPRRGEVGDELPRLKQLTEEALGEAREAVNELAPVRLREEGLMVFLEDCLEKFRSRVPTPIEVSFDLADAEMPEPAALLLLGLLREGLNNIRKHSQATHVGLSIIQRGRRIEFRLADDGVGFSPESCPSLRAPTRHYGLAYLRERIQAIGGEMQLISRPGAGTVVEAHLPILTEERLVALLS